MRLRAWLRILPIYHSNSFLVYVYVEVPFNRFNQHVGCKKYSHSNCTMGSVCLRSMTKAPLLNLAEKLLSAFNIVPLAKKAIVHLSYMYL